MKHGKGNQTWNVGWIGVIFVMQCVGLFVSLWVEAEEEEVFVVGVMKLASLVLPNSKMALTENGSNSMW